MRHFILLLALLLPYISFAASTGSGNTSSVKTLGGILDGTTTPGAIVVPSSDTSRFTLSAGINGSTNPSWYIFRRDGAQYQVPSGKKTRCDSFMVFSSTAGHGVQLVSSQTQWNDNATPSSPTYQCGSALGTSGVCPGITSGSASAWRTYNMTYDFPAQSYPGINEAVNAAQIYVHASCFEYTP